MTEAFKFLGMVLWSWCHSRAACVGEIVFLRQQLRVLRRSTSRRIQLRHTDRLIFVWLFRLFPSVLQSAAIFQPETLIRWRRSGLRLLWCRRSQGRPGRPRIRADIRALIRRMSVENPLWGAPRVHGELLKLGIAVAQSSVAKYMGHRGSPPSQGWRTFLRNHAPHIAVVDLTLAPTVCLTRLCGLLILRLEERFLLLVNVTAHPAAELVTSQIAEACPWSQVPRDLICDHDWVDGAVVKRRLRARGIRDRPIAPRSARQDGHGERLVGRMRPRREFRGDAPALRYGKPHDVPRPSACTHLARAEDISPAGLSRTVGRSDGIIGRYSSQPTVRRHCGVGRTRARSMPRMRWHFLARWHSRKARSPPLRPPTSALEREAL
jgi:hypothetical protein